MCPEKDLSTSRLMDTVSDRTTASSLHRRKHPLYHMLGDLGARAKGLLIRPRPLMRGRSSDQFW